MMTFIAALRHDRIEVPMVLDGPVNGDWFRVEHARNPTLHLGDIVVLDNLGSHKGKAVGQGIRKAGAHLLFLPPYRPDLNPIEQVFSKLKTVLKRRKSAPSKLHGDPWAPCSTASALQNAPTTSSTQALDPT